MKQHPPREFFETGNTFGKRDHLRRFNTDLSEPRVQLNRIHACSFKMNESKKLSQPQKSYRISGYRVRAPYVPMLKQLWLTAWA
jgi:hypothetical protein